MGETHQNEVHPDERDPDVLRAALNREHAERRRAECLAKMQAGVVQLALDLLVREPDIELLRRAHADDGRGGRELFVRRVADRRGAAALRSVDGLRRGSALQASLPERDLSARGRGRTSLLAQARVDPDGRIPVRRSAATGSGAGVQSEVEHRRDHHHAARARQLHARLAHALEPAHAGLRRQLVARRPDRSDCPPGGAGAASQPARRTAPAGRTPQGDPRGTQPAGARYPRQPRAGLRGDPHAAAGGAA